MFKFRLQKILDHFEGEELAKKVEVAKALGVIQKTQSEIQALEAENLSLLAEQKEKAANGFSWLQMILQRIDWNLGSIDTLKAREEEERIVLLKKQRELSHVSVRRKALQSLREKRETAFRLKNSQRAQKQLDEVYQILKREK